MARPRYQYVYAIFSSLGYGPNAQHYAYAHDIYLIPLARSAFLQPIITAIKDILGFALPPNALERRLLKKGLLIPYDPSTLGLMHPQLRRYVRATIRAELDYELPAIVSDTALHLLNQFCHTCGQIDGAVLGMIARQFPVFLVPGPEIDLDDLRECAVEMYWDNNSWYLQLQGAGSFLLIYPPNYSTSTPNAVSSPNNECLL